MNERSNKEVLINSEEIAKKVFNNYHKALQFLNSVEGDIDESVILRIHSHCMEGVLPESATGKYRTIDVGISHASRTPPSWERVRGLMDNFLTDLNRRLSKCSRGLNNLPCLIETISFAHYVFERIHPFEDGNGRVGRLLCDLIAKRFRIRPIIIWPSEREKYIEVLEAVNRSGNLAHLTLFLAKELLKRYPENEPGQNPKIREVLAEIMEVQKEKIEGQTKVGKETDIWRGFADPCFY